MTKPERSVADLMLRTEAAEWIDRVRREGHSRASGRQRLVSILAEIEQRRGRPAREQLERAINDELARQRERADEPR